jgi:hypothetical protein
MSRLSQLGRSSAIWKAQQAAARQASRTVTRRSLATDSGDHAVKPTAVAKLHLEDGTTLIGSSFGSHEAVEGEVSEISRLTN